LLERDHPLAALRDRADRAAQGRGSVVLIAGEAGIGKTELVRAYAEKARVPVLWGMCDALSTPRPLGPLRDVAAVLGPPVTAVLREAVAQHEIFAAVLETLGGRPRVLVIEDLHWGDEATLDLVRFLGRRIATLPLLMVLTYREAVAPTHPLRALLGDLVATPDARRLQLTPLSRAAVAELVGEHGLDAVDVHARTAGNPFFVSQIVAQPESPLPESVRDAVVARTAALASTESRALELLSCAPEGVTGDLLAALGIPGETVAALAATGLLERRGSGLAFRHEIARLAVLDAVAPGAEAALHVSMIEALEAVGGDASVLAHHATAAGDVPRILRYAPVAAADAARAGAHREAVAFFELALSHVGQHDLAGRADLLECLAEELYLTDRLDAAIRARTQALQLRHQIGDVVAVGEGHRVLSLFEWYAADLLSAEREDDAAISILSEAGEPRALGYALANRAYLAAGRGDMAKGLQAGHDAQRIAHDLGDDALHTTASIGMALVRLSGGDHAARSDLIAARDAGLRLHLDQLVSVPMSNLAHHDVEQGRFTEADDILAEALQFSEDRDILICGMWQRGIQARLRLLQGRWRDAEQDALAVLAAGDLPMGRLWAHLVLGLLAARREAPAQNPHLDELWRLATRLDLRGALAAAAAALAEQAWITHRADPRLDDRLGEGLLELPGLTGEQLRRWVRRLAVAGVSGVDVPGSATPSGPPPALEQQPYERALVLWDEGSCDALLAALPLLEDLEARAVVNRVRGKLRELGVASPPRSPSAGSGGLTDRQLDVLGLLAEGLTNTEIAARLVISRKTADHHVSAILGKLDARSRRDAVVTARRLGLLQRLTPDRATDPGQPAAR
jgi:DNA-binding CsgD family transcriptional regulator